MGQHQKEAWRVSTAGGAFVVFEGGDSVGKTTQVDRLCTWLADEGHEVLKTFEPGDTTLGAMIRQIVLDPATGEMSPRTEALLYAADKAQHIYTVVKPALQRGAVVVCDRYVDSMLAYQGAGSGVPIDELRAVQRFATGGLVPDLTILLDLPVEAGLRRKSAEVTRFEAYHDLAYHERVRAAFLAFAVFVRYEGNPEDLFIRPVVTLLPEADRRRALLLGAALQLGYRISAAVPDLLETSRLEVTGDELRLHLPAPDAAPDPDILRPRLRAVAKQLDLPRVRVESSS